MTTLNEMKNFLSENGYTMEQAIDGYYYYCQRNNEDGTTTTMWMDSACEDAYDLDAATSVAYDIVSEIVYSVVLRSVEVSDEELSTSETIHSGSNYNEAKAIFDEKALSLDAEADRCDLELTLYQGEEDDICQDVLAEENDNFVGEKLDGKLIMSIKPKHYYTPYQIVDGDGKTERDIMEISEDIKIEVIEASELTKERMEKFGFPQWFCNEPSVDSSFC